MGVFKRGDTYYYEFLFANKRVRESAKTTSKTVAKEADKLRMNLKLTTLPSESPLPSVQPGEAQAGALFALLEKLEMKSSLTEAKERYSGQKELF